MNLASAVAIASTTLATIAATGAWRAASAARASARHTRIGHRIDLHAKRLDVLRELHSAMSWLTEGGKQRMARPPAKRLVVKLGGSPGTTTVEGVELRGLVVSTGLSLPRCHEVCDHMQRGSLGGPIGAAEAELREAMEVENRVLSELESELTASPWVTKVLVSLPVSVYRRTSVASRWVMRHL